jgi:hypothetical protein
VRRTFNIVAHGCWNVDDLGSSLSWASLVNYRKVILEWLAWVLLFALLAGGSVWIFPENGRVWMENRELK